MNLKCWDRHHINHCIVMLVYYSSKIYMLRRSIRSGGHATIHREEVRRHPCGFWFWVLSGTYSIPFESPLIVIVGAFSFRYFGNVIQFQLDFRCSKAKPNCFFILRFRFKSVELSSTFFSILYTTNHNKRRKRMMLTSLSLITCISLISLLSPHASQITERRYL